ncbi:MAG TPA: Wzz/FepE/Etk N-terminal domain-containing protein, partial [Candidatus Acidoferrales bacterium]|nr:Wzz/FepE/Etk N-terminal domain-containing protein [Candidatus Acidoferrales bacterium]
MDQIHQPSPYFIRRTEAVDNETVAPRAPLPVEETANPLWEYWSIIKRHRWLIGICALATFLCSALYTFTRVKLYTADATVMIERKTPQILKVQDAQAELAESSEFYKTQYEILKSPSFAERVIREEGLQSDPLFTGIKDKGQKTGLVAGFWEDITAWARG